MYTHTHTCVCVYECMCNYMLIKHRHYMHIAFILYTCSVRIPYLIFAMPLLEEGCQLLRKKARIVATINE